MFSNSLITLPVVLQNAYLNGLARTDLQQLINAALFPAPSPRNQSVELWTAGAVSDWLNTFSTGAPNHTTQLSNAVGVFVQANCTPSVYANWLVANAAFLK